MNSKEYIGYSSVLVGGSKPDYLLSNRGTNTGEEVGLIHCSCSKLLYVQSIGFMILQRNRKDRLIFWIRTVLGETAMDFFS